MGESTWNKRLMGPKLQRVQSFAFASAASRLPGFPASRLPGFPASRLPGFPIVILGLPTASLNS